VIGALRQRLTIEVPVSTSDGGGGAVLAWSPVATVWGRVRAVRGAEASRAMRLESHVSHRITIRYRGTVTARHRIVLGTRVFNVRAVLDGADERKRFLTILAEEGVAV